MMKFATAFLLSVATASALAATKIEPGTYAIDTAHSSVGFTIQHLVISEVEGRFDKFEGEITLADKITNSTFKATIDAASINTSNSQRDDHLRNEDFFNVKQFPTITFVSKKVTGTPNNLTVVGDLTMHGVTREVTLKGKITGTVKGMMGETRAGFVASTTIKRKDFGLTWNKAVEAGPVVGEDVKITLKVEATRNESDKKQAQL